MIAALARFVEALRAERHAVSPAEVLDAGRALDLVGLERRGDVKRALRATLAKDRRAAAAFDALFDRYFAPPSFPRGGEKGQRRTAGEAVRPRPGEGDRRAPRQGTPSERERPRRAGAPRAEPSAMRREGTRNRVLVRRAPADAHDPAEADLARRMTTEEERRIAREVPRIVQALKLRTGRRQERARSGRPWLRRALRDNLASGGVPFIIPYRAPKRKTTKVVLVVDVSFSVARASGLFLLMAGEFLELGRRARVLAFVDRPVDATAAIRRWLRGTPATAGFRRRGARPGDGIESKQVSFAEVLDGLRDVNLDAPSDYGTAFHALLTSRLRPRGRDTVVVVLGDGRTNRFGPLPWALEELARGCRAVLWLVPEPRSRWGTADSALPSYLPSVDLAVEATDLVGLARGLAELVKRI